MTVPSQMSVRRIPDALHLQVRVAYALSWEALIDTHTRQALQFITEFASTDPGAGRARSLLPRDRGARGDARGGPLADAHGPRSQDGAGARGDAGPRRVGAGSGSTWPRAQPLSPPLPRADAGARPDGGSTRGGGRRGHARRKRAGAGLAAQGRDGSERRRRPLSCGSSDCRRAWRRWSCSGCRRGSRPTSSPPTWTSHCRPGFEARPGFEPARRVSPNRR